MHLDGGPSNGLRTEVAAAAAAISVAYYRMHRFCLPQRAGWPLAVERSGAFYKT